MIAIRNDVLEENLFDETPWEVVQPCSNFSLYDTHTMGGTRDLITELDLNDWEQA